MEAIVRRAIVVLVFATACSGAATPGTDVAHPATTSSSQAPQARDAESGRAAPPTPARARNQLGFEFPDPPETPDGPLDAALIGHLDAFFSAIGSEIDDTALQGIIESGDARAAWLLADLLRFTGRAPITDTAVEGFETLTGVSIGADPIAARSDWQSVTDHLIAWELPAPPGYVRWKAQLFALADPRWAPFFEDPEADVDWRFVSWGGVRLDDRPLGTATGCPLGCIPALDDPAVTGIAGGSWYPDDAVVFGVVVGDEARAYPRNIMEVHEMVNDTLGGRRLGIPYCTLCGSAQAYFTDSVPEGIDRPLLRTSGLLTRSNKVMFDLNTFSAFDTFTGRAVTGPLHDAAIVLEQTTVITSTWGDWKASHPATTIVAEDGGIGRSYPADPLRGRDDNGPIFPVGDVDERLPVQAEVVGVETADGTPVAFPVVDAVAAIAEGRAVSLMGISLVGDGSGLRAELEDGTAVVSHQSFWFAWSQFHPETLLWQPVTIGG